MLQQHTRAIMVSGATAVGIGFGVVSGRPDVPASCVAVPLRGKPLQGAPWPKTKPQETARDWDYYNSRPGDQTGMREKVRDPLIMCEIVCLVCLVCLVCIVCLVCFVAWL